jgi:hypothetical protein
LERNSTIKTVKINIENKQFDKKQWDCSIEYKANSILMGKIIQIYDFIISQSRQLLL